MDNEEYFDYLLGKTGLLSDYDLFEAGISFDEYSNPDADAIEKLEAFCEKKGH